MPLIVPPPETTAIARALRAAEVDHPQALAALATSSIRITSERTTTAKLPLGASRLGGDPDVPAGFAWPTRDGRPLAFLAQLDLSEVEVVGLPERGWLLFFYDYDNQPWGFDPKDAGAARVVLLDAPRDALRRVEQLAADELERFEPCALSLSATVDLPHPWDRIVEASGHVIEDEEAYDAARETISGVTEDSQYHHLLGHPQLVQNDMRAECELVTNGIYCGDPSGYQSERARSLLPRAADWQLLLQLDTDEEGPGWMWGDCGRLYFWIRRSDLAARAFENAWVVLQCG